MIRGLMIVTALALAGCGQQSDRAPADGIRRVSVQAVTEADVLNKLHSGNATEIAFGQLAKARGHHDRIKNFGATLETDHRTADLRTRILATWINAKLTEPKMADADKAALDTLSKLEGIEFNKAFAAHMFECHKQVIAELTLALKDIPGTATANFIGELMPTLEKHKAMAADLVKNP